MRNWFHALVLLSLFSSLKAQDNYLFERIFINEGLSNNSINAVLQTRDGFLWIATKDGLNRYDGQNFKVFKKIFADSTSLPENYVMSLLECSNGILWVGTWGGGLQKFDRISESFIPCRLPGSKDGFIQCIYEDRYHNIWFGTTEGGLFRLFPEEGRIETYSGSLAGGEEFPSRNITSITEGPDHSLWVGTWDAGLIQLDISKGTFRQFVHDPGDTCSIADNGVWDIRVEPGHKLLLSTFSGLDRFDLSTGRASHGPGIEKRYADPLSSAIRQTLTDSKGRLWIGTYNYEGLFLVSRDDRGVPVNTRYIREDDNDNSISIDRVRCIYEDMKGNIWIGTENGLNKMSARKSFRQYRNQPLRPNSLGGHVVSSLLKGSDHCLWVGYGGGGFDRIDPVTGRMTHYRHDPSNPNSLSDNDVISLYESAGGYLWIATMHGGLNRFDPVTEEFRHYRADPGDAGAIRSDWVLQVMETSDGLFMVGTNSGLDIYDRNSEIFSRYEPEISEGVPSLPEESSVNVLFEDSRKRIWIGTWLDGAFCYDPQHRKLEQYIPEDRDPYSISSDKISVIFEDRNGIWIGTHSGGLNRLDIENGRFYHYSTQSGLPNDVVFGIQGNHGTNLWVSTMKGLVRMDIETGSIRVYDELDGLVDNQFNWRASYKDGQGRVYFGGINGFVAFHPDSISVDTVPPLMAITYLNVFNRETNEQESLPCTREIVLEHDQNFFSIDFTALDMSPGQKHQYAYMLEGIDHDWVYSGTRNTAFYTDLRHGSFQFLARASNADHTWSEPVELSITVLPAWWNTTWIRIAGLFAIFGIGILVARLRFWHLLEIERIRLNIASDLHDEMGSNLSSISVDSQQLMQHYMKDRRAYQLSTDIYRTTNETIDSIRDIIWFINPKNDGGENMLFKMREKASIMLAGMKWTFHVSEGLNMDAVKLGVRRNIFLIYKETINNILRHADAKSCMIHLIRNASSLEMKICDDGKGFNMEKERYSGGLANLHYRAKKIGAHIEITSEMGQGTCVVLKLPIKAPGGARRNIFEKRKADL